MNSIQITSNVDYLTVELSDDSNDIESIRRELDQLKNHANSKDDAIIEHVQKLEQPSDSKLFNVDSEFFLNNMRSR